MYQPKTFKVSDGAIEASSAEGVFFSPICTALSLTIHQDLHLEMYGR